MTKVLTDFRDLRITREKLKDALGEDLHNIDCAHPLIVRPSHVINVIRSYMEKRISLNLLVDWVNTVWFTDLFQFYEAETDSIISVLEILETLDEEDSVLSPAECEKMIQALTQNIVFSES